ncbi:hypothetical protein ETD86_23065 [Nonomuraea turkmeniaca]|uniref:Uncharacterized protein n=1 Tax=Nonomuraea turkmeniaca TaxID=103838 RepID=A0A5S4FF48_9ACTN|nr:hypothetical protein [Nonomuraea turkmeniaca]TMR17510.1 hypothetical protein ETD86_23065 [Nonomuraea turkmeniaca]
MPSTPLESRVAKAAEAALDEQGFVDPIDVLVGMGWLTRAGIENWRRARVPYLEKIVDANLGTLSSALLILRRWAQARELRPSESETVYLSRTRDRRPLRFSKTGDRGLERAYRTHWVPARR